MSLDVGGSETLGPPDELCKRDVVRAEQRFSLTTFLSTNSPPCSIRSCLQIKARHRTLSHCFVSKSSLPKSKAYLRARVRELPTGGTKLSVTKLSFLSNKAPSLTVKPKGNSSSFSVLPKLSVMNDPKHSAQKSNLHRTAKPTSRQPTSPRPFPLNPSSTRLTASAPLPAFAPQSTGTWSG